MSRHYLSETRENLRFLDKYSDHAQDLRRRAAAKREIPLDKINFVGIHNRRTDYIEYMESTYGERHPFGKRYFRDAMDYFREEYENAVFFYVSDDMEWGRANLRKGGQNDLYFVGGGDPDSSDSVGYDLAVLASCNHSVVTWGSFSMWSALLSGGEYYGQYGPIVPIDKQQPIKKKRKRKNSEL